MSVGVLPFAGGQLHVGPVECTSCTAGSEVDDGSPEDANQLMDRLDIDLVDADNNAVYGGYQFPSPSQRS